MEFHYSNLQSMMSHDSSFLKIFPLCYYRQICKLFRDILISLTRFIETNYRNFENISSKEFNGTATEENDIPATVVFCFSFSGIGRKKRKNGHTRGIRREEEKDSRCLDAFIAIFALDRRGKRALRSAVRLPSMLEVEGSLPLDLPTIIPGCGSRFLVVEGHDSGAGSNGGEACRQRVADGGGKARVSSRDTPGVEFSKRTALNGHERVFRSSVPAHAYICIYVPETDPKET